MDPMNIGAGPAFIPPIVNPFMSGMPVAGQLRGAGSSGRSFAPASNGFQLGHGFRSPAQQAVHAAAQEAHAGMLDQVQQCMVPPQAEAQAQRAGGLRLIDSAQSKALEAIFRHADDPAQADATYAAGRYAARIGVEDLAVALSELRIHGGAPEDCERMEKALCKMVVKDGLGDHSGFSAWHEGNCYDKVKKLTLEINAKLDALPNKPDIFEGAMQREVMPAIRAYIEARFGTQSYATWQKIDAAGGLISRAAAEAADRMTETMRAAEQGGGSGALRAKVNQWRVAQHWAEMMRSVDTAPAQARQPAPGPAPEEAAPAHAPSAAAAHPAAAPAPYSVTQTANPVFRPIIVIGGREVDSTLARILEHDAEHGERNPADVGGADDALGTSSARARQTVGAEPPASPTHSNDGHGDNTQGVRHAVLNNDLGRDDVDGNHRPDRVANNAQELLPPASRPIDQVTTELDGGMPHGNSVLPLRPAVQGLRVDIPAPPPQPDSASSSASSSSLPATPPASAAPATPSTPSTSLSTSAPPTATTPATLPQENQGVHNTVTLRSRPLSPVQKLIKQFEDAGIGAQAPSGHAVHSGSLLHRVGNRISTTEWPLLRGVSDGDGRNSNPASPTAEGPDPWRSRPLSPPLQPGYTRLSSEAGRAAVSPYQRLSTAGRTIQVGPAFEPANGK